MSRRIYLEIGALVIALGFGAAGCLSDAVKQNQQMLEAQKAELDNLQQQIAEIKAQQPKYPTTSPPPGSCDRGVMQQATKHGGQQFAEGRFDKALGYYQDAITACPSSGQAQLNVARTYEALGNREQAMEYYRKALSAAPSDQDSSTAVSEQARRALARLAAK